VQEYKKTLEEIEPQISKADETVFKEILRIADRQA
jgi:hypothetical protein